MKERPIIFSGEMVRALIDRRKTQTRRVIVPQPTGPNPPAFKRPHCLDFYDKRKKWVGAYDLDTGIFNAPCPYGKPGDRLWVRETWCPGASFRYKADGGPALFGGWRSPIHMHRKASRITLEITSVRVEGLQWICMADCVAEGVTIPVSLDGCKPGEIKPLIQVSGKYPPAAYLPKKPTEELTEADVFRAEYASLWDTLNAGRGYPWSSKPWVWVISFTSRTHSGIGRE